VALVGSRQTSPLSIISSQHLLPKRAGSFSFDTGGSLVFFFMGSAGGGGGWVGGHPGGGGSWGRILWLGRSNGGEGKLGHLR
jgi:hypothetical protein